MEQEDRKSTSHGSPPPLLEEGNESPEEKKETQTPVDTAQEPSTATIQPAQESHEENTLSASVGRQLSEATEKNAGQPENPALHDQRNACHKQTEKVLPLLLY